MWKNWLNTKRFISPLTGLMSLSLLILPFSGTYAQFTLDWAYSLGGAAIGLPRDIEVDKDGNVYVLGYFRFSADFDPGPGSSILQSEGIYDLFLQKVNNQGELVWVKTWNVYDNTLPQDVEPSRENFIEINSEGEIYISGYFNVTTDFDPGPGTYAITPEYPPELFFEQGFLLKLDSAGNFQWLKSYRDSSGYFDPIHIRLNSENKLVAVGHLTGSYDFDPGPDTLTLLSSQLHSGICIGEYDAQGNFTWIKATGIIRGLGFNKALEIDSDDNLIIYGRFADSADFDPGPGIWMMGKLNYLKQNFFILKLDTDGNLIWAKWMNGPDSAFPLALTRDSQDNILISGRCTAGVDFNPGPDTLYLGVPGSGGTAGFLASYSSAGNLNWAYRFGSGDMYINGIRTDKLNNIYGVGRNTSSNLDYDPGPAVNLGTGGTSFILCISQDKNFRWVTNLALGPVGGQAIDIDSSGTLYTTGGFYGGSVDFDPGPGEWVLTAAPFTNDIYVQKLRQPDLSNNILPVLGIQVYPNPAHEVLFVKIPEGLTGNISLQITDADGRIVFRKQTSGINSELQEIPIAAWKPGAYMLQLNSTNSSHKTTFIKIMPY